MRLSFSVDDSNFTKGQLLAEQKLARAATETVQVATELAKDAAREAMAAGGMSGKFQSAFRGKAYPESGISLHPAGFLSSKIPWAGIFESGGTISPNKGKYLWLPLPGNPLGRGHAGGPWGSLPAGAQLKFIRSKDGKPLLCAVVRETAARAAKPASRRLLRRGRNTGGKGTLRLIPLYVGVRQVAEPAKFNIEQAIESVGDKIPELFVANFGD